MQVHGKDADPFFAEDLEAAQALVDSTDRAELFLYPGEEHLFADSSLPAYDAAAAALLIERVLAFLDTVRPKLEDLCQPQIATAEPIVAMPPPSRGSGNRRCRRR